MRSHRLRYLPVIIVAISLFIFIRLSHAGDLNNNWYIGVHGGATEIENDIVVYALEFFTPYNFEERDFGYKIYGGYRINQFISIETAFADFGEILLSGQAGTRFTSGGQLWEFTSNNTALTVNAKTISAGAVFSLPLHTITKTSWLKKTTPFFKIGAHYNFLDMDINTISGVQNLIKDSDDTDWFYGFGLEFNLYKKLSARLEYEHYNFQEVIAEDVDFISMGLLFNF